MAQGKEAKLAARKVARGSANPPAAAKVATSKVYLEGKKRVAQLYDRRKLRSGNVINGPSIVLEMDSTTVILPTHQGKVDNFGNILITPAK